jgi:hypothetical protein
MRRVCLLFIATALSALAGDYFDGPNRYEIDLSQAFTQYAMTDSDRRWATSLLQNLHQTDRITYLTRTTLPLWCDGKRFDGAIYRSVGKYNDRFYIVDGDAVLITSDNSIISPGCGGFSAHAPKSRNFIVALYFDTPCVSFRRHSDIGRRKLWYYGDHSIDRLRDYQ